MESIDRMVLKETTRQRMKSQGCAVLIPTYCNSGTLYRVVESALEYCDDVFVIDDGSTDDTAQVMLSLSSLGVRCEGYTTNRGKGYALRYGMRLAREAGFQYAITMDSDGQHLADDLPIFLRAIEENPGAFIVGQRDFAQQNMPKGNRFANRFSSFWYKLETGVPLLDTQSGFRAYPLHYFSEGKWLSRGYAYELEALVRWPWRGGVVVPLPMQVYYPPRGERVSHFKPLRDFTLMSLLHTLFTIVGLFFVRPWNYVVRVLGQDLRECISLAREGDARERMRFSLSVGWGVTCGILPIWGYQLLFALGSAHLLRLNRVVVALFSNISLPPMLPFIVYASMQVGAWILCDTIPPMSTSFSFQSLGAHLGSYLLGSLLLAIVSGLVFSMLSLCTLSLFNWRRA